MINDTIEIRCPKCGGVHKYGSKIYLSTFISVIPVFEGIFERIFEDIVRALYKPKIKTEQFTRLFTCPVKHEDFQVVLVKDLVSGNLCPLDAEENKG